MPGVISALINANVSLSRIRNFLLRDENKEDDISYDETPGVALTVSNTDLGWDTKQAALKKYSLNLKPRFNKTEIILNSILALI